MTQRCCLEFVELVGQLAQKLPVRVTQDVRFFVRCLNFCVCSQLAPQSYMSLVCSESTIGVTYLAEKVLRSNFLSR